MLKYFLLFIVLLFGHIYAQNINDCGIGGYGCFTIPDGCNQTSEVSSDCQFVFKYKQNKDDQSLVDFILTATVTDLNAYVAIGFSYEEKMENSSIIVCKYNIDPKIEAVESVYALTKTVPELIEPSEPSLGISNARIQMMDGKLMCSFSRSKSVNQTYSDKFFNISLNNQIHILAAMGKLDENGVIMYHEQKGCSPKKIDFESSELIAAPTISKTTVRLVKAHGALMIIAWVLLASIGIILPRYMKFLFPKRKFAQVDFWFFTHRMLMGSIPAISIVSLIIILIAVGWTWADQQKTRQFIHSITGIVTIGLSILQSLGGYLRPEKTAPIRPVFNWAHRLIGFSTFFLSVFTICIAFNFIIPGNSWALVFAWVGWIFVVPTIFEIIDAKRHRIAVLPDDAQADGMKIEQNQQSTEQLDKMKIVVFVVHFVVQLILTIALIDYLLIFYV